MRDGRDIKGRFVKGHEDIGGRFVKGHSFTEEIKKKMGYQQITNWVMKNEI